MPVVTPDKQRESSSVTYDPERKTIRPDRIYYKLLIGMKQR